VARYDSRAVRRGSGREPIRTKTVADDCNCTFRLASTGFLFDPAALDCVAGGDALFRLDRISPELQEFAGPFQQSEWAAGFARKPAGICPEMAAPVREFAGRERAPLMTLKKPCAVFGVVA